MKCKMNNEEIYGMHIDKCFYKLLIITLKYLPLTIALFNVILLFHEYMNVHIPLLEYAGGFHLLPWFFTYLASNVFKFCELHRLFLYYIFLVNLTRFLVKYNIFWYPELTIIVMIELFFGIMLILTLLTNFIKSKFKVNDKFNKINSSKHD